MEHIQKTTTFTNVVNYLYLFYAINYAWLSTSLFAVDSRGYLLSFMTLVVVMFNLKSLVLIARQRVYKFWSIWACFAFINYYLTWPPVEEIIFPILFRYIFVPLVCMLLIASEFKENVNRALFIISIIFLIYSFVAPIVDPNVFVKYEGVDSLLGNSYALVSTITLFIFVLLFYKKKVNVLVFVILTIAIMSLIVLTGTRKAFFAGIIVLFFYIISLFDFKNIKSYLYVCLFLTIGCYGYQYAIENTIMGERMVLLEEQADDNLPIGAPEYLHYLGDRSPHYYYGWAEFLEKPILGHGPRQSRIGGPTEPAYIHSEYIAQLSDNGIIGFAFFVLFYMSVCRRIQYNYRQNRRYGLVLYGGFFAIIFMNFTTWTWDMPAILIALGIMAIPYELIKN